MPWDWPGMKHRLLGGCTSTDTTSDTALKIVPSANTVPHIRVQTGRARPSSKAFQRRPPDKIARPSKLPDGDMAHITFLTKWSRKKPARICATRRKIPATAPLLPWRDFCCLTVPSSHTKSFLIIITTASISPNTRPMNPQPFANSNNFAASIPPLTKNASALPAPLILACANTSTCKSGTSFRPCGRRALTATL